MHENERFRHLSSKKNLIKAENLLRKRFRERRECLGGEQARTDRGNEVQIAQNLYIDP